MFRIISLILLLISTGFSQNKDPEIMLERVKEKFKKIENYKADITVKVDIPFIKMPERNATLYFKQPDKIHIESDGFAMLPKEGINFSPISLFESEHTSFYEKEEMIEDVNAAVIKVIPLNDKSDLVLSTLWIDPIKNLILKVESSRKPTGTFVIEFDYIEMEDGLNLPEAIELVRAVQYPVEVCRRSECGDSHHLPAAWLLVLHRYRCTVDPNVTADDEFRMAEAQFARYRVRTGRVA